MMSVEYLNKVIGCQSATLCKAIPKAIIRDLVISHKSERLITNISDTVHQDKIFCTRLNYLFT